MKNQPDLLFAMTVWLMALAVMLGGATRSGFVGDVIAQFLALPLLLAVLWTVLDTWSRRTHVLLALCAGVVLVTALQLMPIPPHLLDGSAAHQLVLAGRLAAGNATEAWRPVSVAPQHTVLAAISVLPALAIFGSTLLMSTAQQWRLTQVLMIMVTVSLAVGLVQVAQGSSSELRFYAITNPTEAVGFFANRNHFAALLYCGLVFAAAGIAARLHRSTMDHSNSAFVTSRGSVRANGWLVSLLYALLIIGIVAGLVMTRSRAGLFLGVVAIVGVAGLFAQSLRKVPYVGAHRRTMRSSRWSATSLVRYPSFGLLGFAILFALGFGFDRLASRFAADPLEDLRIPLNQTTLELAWSHLWTGTGMGTFVPVYGAFEKSGDVFPVYANRAHNDLAEFVLELGMIGVGIIVAFIGWLIVCTTRQWGELRSPTTSADNDGGLLGAAASLVLVLIACHSVVDYPLRTTAISVVFAFCCGVLASRQIFEAESSSAYIGLEHGDPSELSNGRHLAATPPLRQDAYGDVARIENPWRPDTSWPEAWRRANRSNDPKD